MALSAANLELGVTGLKPVSVAVTAASLLQLHLWGGPALELLTSPDTNTACKPLCPWGDGDGGWVGRECSTEISLPWLRGWRIQQLFGAAVHPILLLRFFLCETNRSFQIQKC